MRRLPFLVVAFSLAAIALGPTRSLAQPRFIEGIFLGTESGVIELIAWAEGSIRGHLSMAQGFIEDAPVIPRTYRILCNLTGWTPVGVLLVNSDIFKVSADHLENKLAAYSNVKLGISTFEVGVPELEDWDKVLRLKKTLKANADKPLYVFLIMSNGTVNRYYPFRVERD